LEGKMHDTHGNRGPGRGLLLLIPAALILASAAKHRRQAMWEMAGSSAQPGGRRHGHHRRFGYAEGDPDTFRLPPKIESMLDAWHTRTHAASKSDEAQASSASTEDATA